MTADRAVMPVVPRRPGTHDQRLALDMCWLSVLVVAVGGTLALWLNGRLQIEPALWAMFLCTGAALAIDAVLERVAGRVRIHLMEVTQAQRLLWLAVLWHVVGGIDAPIFLLAFTPAWVAATIVMRPRLPWVTAGAAVVGVSAMAVVESPELRWFFLQRGLPVEWIMALPSDRLRVATTSAALERDPQEQWAVLVLFALSAFALAFVAAPLGGRVRRICEHIRITRAHAASTLDPLRAMIDQAQTPTALVHPQDGLIVAASRSFINQMLLSQDDVARRSIFDALSFDSEASVRHLLSLQSGILPVTRYQIGTECRAARITAHRVTLADAVYAVLGVADLDGVDYEAMDPAAPKPEGERRVS